MEGLVKRINDLFKFLDDFAREHRLLEWRHNRDYRRQLIQAVALHAIDRNISNLKELLQELKRLVHYYDLEPRDRAVFRKSETYLRKIVGGWDRLNSDVQLTFRRGEIPPSTLAATLT